MSLTIFPIRAVFLVISLLSLWVVGIIIARGLNNEKPVYGWRKYVFLIFSSLFCIFLIKNIYLRIMYKFIFKEKCIQLQGF